MNRIINETEINNDTIEYEYKFVYPQSNKDTLSILYYYEKNKLQYKEVSFIKLVDSTKYVARDTLKTCRYNAKDSLLWCGDEIRLYNDSIIINDYLRSTSKGVKIKSRNTKIVCAKWDYKVFEEITKNHIKKIHIVFDRNERVKDFITQDYYLKNGKLFQIGDKNSWKWVFTYNHYGLPKKVTFFDENNNIIRKYVYSYVAM